MEKAIKITENKSERLYIQERDVAIFSFLDRVGFANTAQIARFVLNDESEKAQNAISRRVYLLRRFDYLKTFNTQLGSYFALTTKSKLSNQLISGIKFDLLLHHNFLMDLFYLARDREVLTEREVLAKYKVIGKKGKIPDMVIDDWIIEYERTRKSSTDCKAVLDHWVVDNDRRICVIYENEEIRNKYQKHITNPAKVKLLSRADYQSILIVLDGHNSSSLLTPPSFTPTAQAPNGAGGVSSVADKYR